MWRNLLKTKFFSNCQNAIVNKDGNNNGKNILLSFVRHRKPIWAPLAATKLHRVVERKEIDVEEAEEMKVTSFCGDVFRFDLNYAFNLDLCSEYFKQENEAREILKVKSARVADEKDFKELVIKVNDEWNAESARIRKNLDEKEAVVKDEEYLELIDELNRKDAERNEIATALLEQANRERPNFITETNLDQAIEESLNKRTTHNFYIDLEGNRYCENPDGSVDMKPRNPTSGDFKSESETRDGRDEEEDGPVDGEIVGDNHDSEDVNNKVDSANDISKDSR
ncbi:hypothetical protein HELRODRAFT_173483 [Helobdella robusta]|uniref:Small ribosomal subunit protein mS26 n=1 Tax=Helobdella robusta TaxID=6412 RepID=T1F6V5_HELRO|nr:hypothetical protein HELRODRAFT_173483 [Helobdella robusta]ESO03780.1 hypothetical protein HELRODRAFT_173483 [Helobdella robusta]